MKRKKKEKLYLPGTALAGLLLAYATINGVPGAVMKDGNEMVAGAIVGAYASVASTPENTILAQLTAKEAALDQREAALASKENVPAPKSDLPIYSFILSIALLILIAVNFFYDWKRGRAHHIVQQVVDLKRR